MKCYDTYIPTALSEREARRLQHYALGAQVVEAGALLGFSTIAMAEVAQSVVSIDHHRGYFGNKYSLALFLRNIDVCNVAHKVTTVVADASALRWHSENTDFAFIDLDGKKSTTLRAIQMCQASIIAVHDYARLNCGGVAAAVTASSLEVIERADSLIVLRNGRLH